MIDYIIKISWILALVFVLSGLLGRLVGVDIMGVRYNINYFHAANTALLFGILFSLQKRS